MMIFKSRILNFFEIQLYFQFFDETENMILYMLPLFSVMLCKNKKDHWIYFTIVILFLRLNFAYNYYNYKQNLIEMWKNKK